MRDPLIEVDGLTKVFQPASRALRLLIRTPIRDEVTALHDVSLHVDAGHISAVVGPNGAGKSTLFRILTGLTTPTTGSARVLGHDVERDAPAVRRVVGFMAGEDRSLYMRNTCVENLAFHGRLHGMSAQALDRRIDEMLDLVGLAAARDHAGFALSAGMRARLQLARALLHRPSVLILDEPTGSIDPIEAHELFDSILRVTTEQGIGVLVSTHRLDEIEALHDNVAVLDRGELLYWGHLDALRRLWDQPTVELVFTGTTAARAAATRLREQHAVEVLSTNDDSVVVATRSGVGPALAELDGALPNLVSVHQPRMTMRELLLALLGRSEDGRRS